MIALFEDVKQEEAFLQNAEIALRAYWGTKPFKAQHPDADQTTIEVTEVATEGTWEFGGLEAIKPGTVKAGYAVPIGVFLHFKLRGSGLDEEEEQSLGSQGDLEVKFPDGFQEMSVAEIAEGSAVEILSSLVNLAGAAPLEEPLETISEEPEP